MTSRIRTYSQLSQIEGFEERYEYLRLRSTVGIDTFGYDRWLNQAFYTSTQWRQLRHHVIARDRGFDLGVEGYPVTHKIVVHHMNPLTVSEVTHSDESMFDPEFLISASLRTHNAIHYGDKSQLAKPPVARRPGDTKLW